MPISELQDLNSCAFVVTVQFHFYNLYKTKASDVNAKCVRNWVVQNVMFTDSFRGFIKFLPVIGDGWHNNLLSVCIMKLNVFTYASIYSTHQYVVTFYKCFFQKMLLME